MAAEENHLSAGGGGVADEMNAFERYIGQQAYSQGAFPPDVIAKGACQKDLLYVVIFEADFFLQEFYSGPDSGFCELNLTNILLSENYFFSKTKSRLAILLNNSRANNRWKLGGFGKSSG